MVLEWKRYCYPRGSEPSIEYWNGYVADPQSTFGVVRNPLLQTFSSIQHYKCLVLLGEPGIGKSQVMRETAALMRSQTNSDDAYLEVNLGSYGQEGRLVEELFQCETYLSWAGGKNRLFLFLDSLDEGMLQIQVLCTLLTDKLRNADVSRLYIRIACRTGAFPKGFEETLSTLWGHKEAQYFQLAPLTESNVRDAVRLRSLDDDAFIYSLHERKAESFAIRPVTLKMLLDIVERNEHLPSSIYEIYHTGCKLLCEEVNNLRRDKPGIVGKLSSNQKMNIASRIAAVSLLCNRRRLFTGYESWLSSDEELSLFSELTTLLMDIPKSSIEETLRTGLFINYSTNSMVWAHQTYLEFLAAEFIIEHNWNTVQIMNFIVHPADHEGRFISQLHELVAWLASRREDIFTEVLEREPNLLFLTDPSFFTDAQRAKAISEILLCYSQDRHFASYARRSFFRELYHPEMSGQLATILKSSDYSEECRRLTIQIAVDCQLTEFNSDLLTLAEGYHGDFKQSLLRGYLKLCPKDKRGEVLKTVKMANESTEIIDLLVTELFPEYLTVDQAFGLIVKTELQSDRLKRFASNHVITLEETQILDLLIWLERNLAEMTTETSKAVYDATLVHSMTYWGNEKICTQMIKLVCQNYLYHGVYYFNDNYINDPQPSFLTQLKANTEIHQMFLDSLWKEAQMEMGPWIEHLIANNLILDGMEINQIIRNLSSTKNPALWTVIVLLLLKPDHKEHRTFMKDDELCYFTEHFFPSISLSDAPLWSNIHDKLHHPKVNLWETNEETNIYMIQNLLEQFEAGNINCWYLIVQEIRRKEDQWFRPVDVKGLAQCKGWAKLDSITQSRIAEGAKTYLLSNPNPIESRDIERFLYTLELLYEREEQLLKETIIPEIGSFWIEAVIGLHNCSLNALQSLTALAYRTDPIRTKHYVLQNVKRLSRGWGVKHVVYNQVQTCWDKEMYYALKQLIDKPNITLGTKSCIMDLMLWLEWELTYKYIMDLLDNRDNCEVPQNEIIEFSCTLMERLSNRTWDKMWDIMQEDIQFREAVLNHIGKTFRNYPFLNDVGVLTEDRLVELYIWIERYTSYTPYTLEEWRGKILRNLKKRKTIESETAIMQLRKTIPESNEVKYAWEEIRRDFLTRKWNPPLPRVITELELNNKKLPVLNGMQLVDTIISIMQDFEMRLRSNNPITSLFWNIDVPVYKPKEENDITDWLKYFLEENLSQKGIILNREVEVLRGHGGIKGERLDIKVDLPVYGREIVTVPIEVKGCWNPGLDNAMETQLIQRYMMHHHCEFGLYIVGFFNCQQWFASKDSRLKYVKMQTLEETRKKFDDQARDLSLRYSLCVKSYVLNLSLP